jgi:hypothetical protein
MNMMPRLTDQAFRPFSPFGRGIGSLGGGLDQAFNPLKGFLSQTIAEEQVEPFVDEVKQMAQERFDLNGNAFQPQMLQPRTRDEISVPRELQKKQFDSFITNGFGQYADGGPVTAGLGSFLTSNIDEFGRNGDTEVIHATKSEVMMPKGMMDDPKVRQTVRDLFEQTGRDMAEYTVGSGQMNVNPITGYEEAFDLIGGIKDIFKKAAPILLPAAVSFLFPGMSPFVSGAIAGGVGSLLQGGDMQDAFKAGLTGGLSSAAATTLLKGGGIGAGFKPLDANYDSPFQMRKFGSQVPSAAREVAIQTSAGGLPTDQVQPSFFEDPISSSKNFLMKPELSADAAAKQLGFDSYVAIPDATAKAAAMDLVKSSGGINYATAIPAGLGVMGLAGGFDEIEEDPPEDPYPYTTRELLEMYPERYRTGRIVAPIRMAAKGGEMDLENDPRMQKDRMTFPRRQGYISGPGTETSDDIPAMLSDGEFVMTARAVRGAGDGSRKKGVKKMYDIMRAFEGGVVA